MGNFEEREKYMRWNKADLLHIVKTKRDSMKEKLYCNWLKISSCIIILGIILDIGVELTGVSQFTVTESYMDYIFAAVVSVGLLSFSIIALVAGILQEKFYGYKLRELLTFDGVKKRINLRIYIKTSLLQIVLGIVLLSLYFRVSCVNTMICLLVATIFSAGCMAYSVFDIMINDESVYKTLENGYGSLVKRDFNKNGKISYHVNTLTNALIESCKERNLEEMEELCKLYSILIQSVDNKENLPWEQVNFVETRFQQVCCNISTEFGYSKMIEQSIKMLNGVSKYGYWKEDLYLKPILEMKYFNDEELEKNDYRNQVLSLCALKVYKDGSITDYDWKRILYRYFWVLIKNESATLKIKYQTLKSYLSELLYFSRNCEDGKLLVEEEVALEILKYILNTDNIEEQEKIYTLFIRSITVKNQYEKDMHYFLFLSMVFQLIYYYAYCEMDVRTEEYRKKIRNLLYTTITDDMISGLRASFLLEENLENILISFQYRVPKDISITDTFEANTDFIIAKYKIWTKDFNVKFLFMLYCQYYDLIGCFYKLSDFFQWNGMLGTEKDAILKLLNGFFDKETGLLKEEFIKECKQLGELYNHNYDIADMEQHCIYAWIQDEQIKLVDTELAGSEPDEEGSLNTTMIARYLDENMQRNKFFGWNPEDKMDFYIRYTQITGIMHYSDNSDIDHEKTVAGLVETCGQEALNGFIKSKCQKLSISYDEKGIENVLKLIEETDYSMRNFSYTSDWALARYVQSQTYKQLREKENAIPICRMHGINEHIYSKKNNFSYKFVISKARMKNLTEQECLRELERLGKYKEFYHVDGVLLDKKRAVECIRRKYYAYEFDFKLYIKFKPKDVVWFCREKA